MSLKLMTGNNTLLSLLLCCLGISAIAQNDSQHRYAKLVPDGSGGFKIIHLVDTLSTSDRLNKKLDTISAAFYPISDSILTSLDSDIPREYFSGTIRNSFSEKNHVSMSYFIRTFKYKGAAFNPIMVETDNMLFLIDSIDITKRDSILNTEPQRWIASRLAQNRNILSNGYLCFSGEEAVIHKSYGKNIMNADGITVIQSISPLYGTCALGLVEEVILYKKNVGYFGLQYSLYKDFGREISFREASDLIDSLIKQTWGIIRFNKD